LAADQPKLQMEKLNERLDLLVNSGPIDPGRDLLVNSGPIDPGRLEQEMAFLADKLDVSEECVRLESHCHRFLEALKGDEPAGKKLGFLLQELNREANTISAKSASAEISHLAVFKGGNRASAGADTEFGIMDYSSGRSADRGRFIVISSPSGGGKSTIIKRLLEKDKNLTYSVSATTRPPRDGERNGESYWFLTREEFIEKRQGRVH